MKCIPQREKRVKNAVETAKPVVVAIKRMKNKAGDSPVFLLRDLFRATYYIYSGVWWRGNCIKTFILKKIKKVKKILKSFSKTLDFIFG